MIVDRSTSAWLTVGGQDDVLETWPEFVDFVAAQFSEGRWHFRGCLSHHGLASSLERAAIDWQMPLSELPNLERRLLREFKRAFPHATEVEPPRQDDHLAWLALMQHYGAPTRLLDWTYSPFVAAFFALEMLLNTPPDKEDRRAAVWALSGSAIGNDVVRAMIPEGDLRNHFDHHARHRDGPSFKAVFMNAQPPLSFATPTNAYRLNARLIVQQGLFVAPGDVGRSFEENLQAVPNATASSMLRRILLPRSVLTMAFASLKKMNIGAASLFPGVDGFARSLRHNLEFIRTVLLFDGTEE